MAADRNRYLIFVPSWADVFVAFIDWCVANEGGALRKIVERIIPNHLKEVEYSKSNILLNSR